jgi:hypothetical protein
MNMFIVAGCQVVMLHVPFKFVINCIGSLTIYFTCSWIHSKCIVCMFGKEGVKCCCHMLLSCSSLSLLVRFIYSSIRLSLCMSMYVSVHPFSYLSLSICLPVCFSCFILWSSESWHCVDWYVCTNILREHITFNFKVENEDGLKKHSVFCFSSEGILDSVPAS